MKITVSYEEAVRLICEKIPGATEVVISRKKKIPVSDLPVQCKQALNAIAQHFTEEQATSGKIPFIKSIREIFAHLGLADAKYLTERGRSLLIREFSKGKIPVFTFDHILSWQVPH